MKLTDEEFLRIVGYIKNNYGIDLSKKRLLIEGRLNFTVTDNGYSCYNDYLDDIFKESSGAAYNHFISKLTTNHTYFMRESAHFDFLVNTVLPEIESTVKDRDVRIWSAGCSFGNEPYNLAMCIDEYFGERKAKWDLKILATDISSKALLSAKNGVFKAEDLNDIPKHWLTKYFIKLPDNQYKICDTIRKEVVFKYFNLMDEFSHKKPFDLILCRNVMIYFDTPTRETLIKKFYDATKQGGYFFIGHAESITKNTGFKVIKPAIYKK